MRVAALTQERNAAIRERAQSQIGRKRAASLTQSGRALGTSRRQRNPECHTFLAAITCGTIAQTLAASPRRTHTASSTTRHETPRQPAHPRERHFPGVAEKVRGRLRRPGRLEGGGLRGAHPGRPSVLSGGRNGTRRRHAWPRAGIPGDDPRQQPEAPADARRYRVRLPQRDSAGKRPRMADGDVSEATGHGVTAARKPRRPLPRPARDRPRAAPLTACRPPSPLAPRNGRRTRACRCRCPRGHRL